jgi:hypothetical protein
MHDVEKASVKSRRAAVIGPDPTWRSLYTAGGIAAALYVLLAIVVPGVMVMLARYELKLNGAGLLEFISGHRTWWMILQTLVLESSVFLIVTFVALFVGLKHLNKSYAAIGAAVGAASQVLFMAYYPVLLGLVYLSSQFAVATGEKRDVFSTAAEALVAQNNAFNPVYETLFAAGVLILSLMMVKGAFHRVVAWLGIAAAASVVTAMALFPIIGLGYLFWWVVMTIWLVAVAWMLFKQGRA